jgi:hypothetical protein
MQKAALFASLLLLYMYYARLVERVGCYEALLGAELLLVGLEV